MLDWISKTQRTISLSTAEAELLAAQLCLRECLTVLILLEMLQVDVEVELLVDSAAALSILLTGISSKLRYAAKSQGLAAAWSNSVIQDFCIRARKVATDHNLADLFTKGVPKEVLDALEPYMCGKASLGDLLSKNLEWNTTRKESTDESKEDAKNNEAG